MSFGVRISACVLSLLGLAACSSESSTEVKKQSFVYGDKPADEYFAQFNIKMENCEKSNQSKMLRKAATDGMSTRPGMDLGNGHRWSADLFMTSGKYKMNLQISKPSPDMPNAVSVEMNGTFVGLTRLQEGELQLLGTNGEVVGTLSYGGSFNKAEMMILVPSQAMIAEFSSEIRTLLAPAAGTKVYVRQVRESLTEQEGLRGCSQGPESLVF